MDGDKSVSLFSSKDGVAWAQGAVVYGVSVDTPLETELTFMPSGKLLALVRMDGTDEELLGDSGRLRTKICWADPPLRPVRLLHRARRRAPGRPAELLPRRPALRGGAQAPRRRRQEAHRALRDHGRFRPGRRPRDQGVGRAPERGRHLVRGRREHRRGSRPPELVLRQPPEGRRLGPRDVDITDIWQGTIDFTKLLVGGAETPPNPP